MVLNGRGPPVTLPPMSKELLCNDDPPPPSAGGIGEGGGFSRVCMMSLNGLESLIFPVSFVL